VPELRLLELRFVPLLPPDLPELRPPVARDEVARDEVARDEVARDEPARDDELARDEAEREEAERRPEERVELERPVVELEPDATFASCFWAWSNSRCSALASLPLSRRALETKVRRSLYRSPAPLPRSRLLPLPSSVSAFCAVSSDLLSRLSAAGSLNRDRGRRIVLA